MIDPEKTNLGVPSLFIQGDGVIELSEVVESRGLVGRDREGIRIIRANVGLACRESLCKEDLCLGGMSQRAICAAQSNLQIGDDERVADDVTFESVQPYLGYVRDPANGYEGVTFPVEDGMEISCRL